FSNLAVEAGAKAAIFETDAATEAYLNGRTATRNASREGEISGDGNAVRADADAIYCREIVVDVSQTSPRVAVPHSPNEVVEIGDAVGTPVQMVFLGTCT